jgi:predicted regulator of Ras-like GTPase activity (Roadblock/LC7/MglB family)
VIGPRPAAMTAHLTLTAETVGPLLAALESLGAEAEARRVAVLHDSGLVLAESGEEAHRDRGESGALAAGVFFAARQLARRLGDEAFTGLHYEGASIDFLLADAGPETLLLVVFDDRTRPAIVRACVTKHLPAIAAAAARLHEPPASPVDPATWLPTGPVFRETAAPAGIDLASIFHS